MRRSVPIQFIRLPLARRLVSLEGATVRRARVNRRSDRSHWPRPPWARSKDARARARLSHIGRCDCSHHSIVGSLQTTAIADLPDRCPPTGFGLLQRLCRFGLGLGDFRISARLDALLDDAEFGRDSVPKESAGAESTAWATSAAWASMKDSRSMGFIDARCERISVWTMASLTFAAGFGVKPSCSFQRASCSRPKLEPSRATSLSRARQLPWWQWNPARGATFSSA